MRYAFLAYASWGLVPLYWSLLGSIPAETILAHRVFWSIFFFGFLLWRARGARSSWLPRPDVRSLGLVLLSSVLIGTNWFLYIHAVTSGHVLESSLGYFINPLVNVLLGFVFLGERLRPRESLALSLAAIGVLWIASHANGIPWLALTLAFTFGLYGLVRKRLKGLRPIEGSFLESALIAPLAIAYLCLPEPRAVWAEADLLSQGLLVLSGVVTAFPLYWFVLAAERLPLTTLGFFQFLSPTLQFLCAVLVFREQLGGGMLTGFIWIWAGLAVFAASRFDRRRSLG